MSSTHIEQLGYLIAKKAPDMSRGLRIETSYGEIDIPPGPLAELIKDAVTQHYMLELMHAEQLARQATGSAA